MHDFIYSAQCIFLFEFEGVQFWCRFRVVHGFGLLFQQTDFTRGCLIYMTPCVQQLHTRETL